MFDELVTDGFRIVNNKDIVPRIPRSSKTNRFLQYEHVGRTVMISEGAAGEGEGNQSQGGSEPALLWVQGECCSPSYCYSLLCFTLNQCT
jgi:hypothetical protein